MMSPNQFKIEVMKFRIIETKVSPKTEGVVSSNNVRKVIKTNLTKERAEIIADKLNEKQLSNVGESLTCYYIEKE